MSLDPFEVSLRFLFVPVVFLLLVWVFVGSLYGPLWDRFRVLLGPFGASLGSSKSLLRPFWARFGFSLEKVRGRDEGWGEGGKGGKGGRVKFLTESDRFWACPGWNCQI